MRNLLSSTLVVDEDGNATDDPVRPGILTRQAWLASFSEAEENDPIHRGYFIREQLLCMPIPDIPIDVVPQLPDLGEDATLREELAQHVEDPSCATCHNLMDPLGLPFESYDHYGFPRTEEAGRPVDATGAITATQALDGPVANAAELVERLASSSEVERCFVRHLFRFLVGRDETVGDACTLQAAHEVYQSSDGSLRATVESIMTSEAFLVRAGGAP